MGHLMKAREISEGNPYWVQILDIFESDCSDITSDHHRNLYIVTEFCQGGQLSEEIRKRNIANPSNTYTEKQALEIYFQLLLAIKVCHTEKWDVLHKDIKPQTIYFNKGNLSIDCIKLGGYVCSENIMKDSETTRYSHPRVYSAPEFYFPGTDKGIWCDVWACSCIFYEMIFGEGVSDKAMDDFEIMDKLLSGDLKKNCMEKSEIGNGDRLSDDCADLLRKIFEKDYKLRIAYGELILHECFDFCRDRYRQCLSKQWQIVIFGL